MTDAQNSPTDDGEGDVLQREDVENLRVSRDAFSVKIDDGSPVIQIGQTEIHLNVHYVNIAEGGFSTYDDGTDAEWDADPDAGVWFTVLDESEEEYVEIDPVIQHANEEVSADEN